MTALACVSASPIPLYWPEGQVRIVFDGDGVLFSDEAERVFKTKGLEAFFQFERENGHIALPKGPMQAFALKLQRVRTALGDDNKWRVRTFLVTARNDVANVRVFNTLKEWGLDIDETHFLGGLDKTPFVRSINPAIFFDDSSEHIDRAKQIVPVARVVYGINNAETASPIVALKTVATTST
jgi:5'-nucleotidase